MASEFFESDNDTSSGNDEQTALLSPSCQAEAAAATSTALLDLSSAEEGRSRTPDNSSEGIHCRICFDSDLRPEGWINPCKCAGSQEWVHVECLEKWRITSNAEGAMDRCPTCLYYYKFRDQPRINTMIDNVCLGISKMRCGFISLNVFLLLICSIMTGVWDPKGVHLHTVLPFLPADANSQALWFMVLTGALILFYLLFFLVSFLFIKKKKLYLYWLITDRFLPLKIILVGSAIGFSYYINLILMAGLIFSALLVIVLNYVNFLKRMDTNAGQVVLPYSE